MRNKIEIGAFTVTQPMSVCSDGGLSAPQILYVSYLS